MITQNHPAVHELNIVKKIANLMDSKFIIHGTKIKFGLDPILGLIPGLGLITSSIISLLLLFIIGRHGASGKIIILMLLNILLDAIITSIPIIGNIGDIFYRANNINIKIIENYYQHNKHQSNGLYILVIIVILLISSLILLSFGAYKLIELLLNQIYI